MKQEIIKATLKGTNKKDSSQNIVTSKKKINSNVTSPINSRSKKKNPDLVSLEYGLIDSRDVSMDKSIVLKADNVTSKQDVLNIGTNSIIDRTYLSQNNPYTSPKSLKVSKYKKK